MLAVVVCLLKLCQEAVSYTHLDVYKRQAEILYTEEGKARQIRRAERPEDYFATLYGFDFESDQ